MIDRGISTSQQRLRTVLRTPSAQPQAIAETILEESGLQEQAAYNPYTDLSQRIPIEPASEARKDKPMTSPSHVALSMKSMIANLDERSSQIAERAARVEKRAHVAFDKYETVLGAKEAEVEALEDALNQHTNGGGEE